MATRKQLEGLGVSLPPDSAFKVDLSWSDFKIIGLWLLAKIGIVSSTTLPVATQGGQVLRSGSVSPFAPVWSTLPVSEGGNGVSDAGKIAIFGDNGELRATTMLMNSINQLGDEGSTFNGLASFGAGVNLLGESKVFFGSGSIIGSSGDGIIELMNSTEDPAIIVVQRIRSFSPDGTPYDLIPPNGGGSCEWTPVV